MKLQGLLPLLLSTAHRARQARAGWEQRSGFLLNGSPQELERWCPQATEPPALPSASTAKRPPCRCGAALLTIEAVLTSGRSAHLEVSSRRRSPDHGSRASCGRGNRTSSHTARQCPANLCHGPLAHTPPRPRRRSGAQPFAPSQHWQAKLAALRSSKGESHGCLTAASSPHCTPAKLVRCPHRALSCQPRCQRRASPSTRPARGGGGPALIRSGIATQSYKLWVAMPRLPRNSPCPFREKA